MARSGGERRSGVSERHGDPVLKLPAPAAASAFWTASPDRRTPAAVARIFTRPARPDARGYRRAIAIAGSLRSRADQIDELAGHQPALLTARRRSLDNRQSLEPRGSDDPPQPKVRRPDGTASRLGPAAVDLLTSGPVRSPAGSLVPPFWAKPESPIQASDRTRLVQRSCKAAR